MPIEKTPSTNACRRVKPKIETRAKKIADENHEQVTSCGNGPAQTDVIMRREKTQSLPKHTHPLVQPSLSSGAWLHPSCIHDSRQTAKYRFTQRGKYSDRDLTEKSYTHSQWISLESHWFLMDTGPTIRQQLIAAEVCGDGKRKGLSDLR